MTTFGWQLNHSSRYATHRTGYRAYQVYYLEDYRVRVSVTQPDLVRAMASVYDNDLKPRLAVQLGVLVFSDINTGNSHKCPHHKRGFLFASGSGNHQVTITLPSADSDLLLYRHRCSGFIDSYLHLLRYESTFIVLTCSARIYRFS